MTRIGVYLFSLLTALAVSMPSLSFAQKENKNFKAEGKGFFLGKAKDTKSTINLLNFPQINQINYYQDPSLLSKIESLEKAGKKEELFEALKIYVNNFGVQNFIQDGQLIWKLGLLAEEFDDNVLALQVYGLAIKNYRLGHEIPDLKIRYEAINENNVRSYVPLKYYYELVNYRSQIDTLIPQNGVLVNMGGLINSLSPDYGPSINSTGDKMIFSSQRMKRSTLDLKSTAIENLYLSEYKDGYWNEAKLITGINTPYNEGSACLSKDGQMIYFVRCDSPDGLGSCDIFSASRQEDGTWGDIQNLGKEVNSPNWDSHPSLSPSEDTLYFSSDRTGGFGMADIYFAIKDAKGKWSNVQNMGPEINSKNNELSPFYHPVYKVLYFSSNGQLFNFGDYDIYKTYQTLTGAWTPPMNLGPLVNTPGREYYFTIDPKAKEIYYAKSDSNRIKDLDLYSFPLPMEGQPLATTRFNGQILDQEGKPVQGIVSIIDLDNGIEVAPQYLRPDGSFEFDLINKNNYLLIIQGDEFFRIEEIFFLDGETTFQRTIEPIEAKIQFSSVEFAYGKADILPEMEADLTKIADFLVDHPNLKLVISGHTDGKGDPSFNLKLSQDRADNIRKFIEEKGKLKKNRITSRGYGSSKPIVEEKTDEDRKLNRRVEFEIIRE